MKELPKTYDPKAVESKIYDLWMKGGYFKGVIDPDKKPFSIVMPPPNVTGQLHMGHALDATLQDILTRYKRMQGYSALWLPGVDHAGISTQVKVEEVLGKMVRIQTRPGQYGAGRARPWEFYILGDGDVQAVRGIKDLSLQQAPVQQPQANQPQPQQQAPQQIQYAQQQAAQALGYQQQAPVPQQVPQQPMGMVGEPAGGYYDQDIPF